MLTWIRNNLAMLLAALAAGLHTQGAQAVADRLQPTGGGGPRPVTPK